MDGTWGYCVECDRWYLEHAEEEDLGCPFCGLERTVPAPDFEEWTLEPAAPAHRLDGVSLREAVLRVAHREGFSLEEDDGPIADL